MDIEHKQYIHESSEDEEADMNILK
jgi:AdoMet-dependent rRNA methyltransferase SPB1